MIVRRRGRRRNRSVTGKRRRKRSVRGEMRKGSVRRKMGKMSGTWN